jgi:hypothetical protein
MAEMNFLNLSNLFIYRNFQSTQKHVGQEFPKTLYTAQRGIDRILLISHNILVKAKNFLAFQGDVEAVASLSITSRTLSSYRTNKWILELASDSFGV